MSIYSFRWHRWWYRFGAGWTPLRHTGTFLYTAMLAFFGVTSAVSPFVRSASIKDQCVAVKHRFPVDSSAL